VLVVEVLAWVALAAMLVLLGSQLVGWSRNKLIVTLQAATPYLLVLSLPIAVVAFVAGRWVLGSLAALALAAFVALAWPLRFPPQQVQVAAGGRALRVFHGNLLCYNARTAELARDLAALDVDVLAFTEYTQAHSGGFTVGPFAERFPYRIEQAEAKAGGSAIWSRFPLTQVDAPPAAYLSSAAVVAAPQPVTLLVVHPPNPLIDLDQWLAELAGFASLAERASPATIVVGDFNATYWHPPFRRVLAAGWRDAHQLAGRGFSCSWPADKSWLPPFLRLDHALVHGAVAVVGVDDVDLPGSDHHGLVVSAVVTPSAQGAPAARSR
jgi:endonuclease/exonuclease/phosphatase (EEP) superfamily protein YafD